MRGRSLMLPFVAVRNTLTPFLLFLIAVPALALGGGERWLIGAYLGAQITAALVAVVWFGRVFPEASLGAMLRAPRDRGLLAFSLPQGLTEFLNLLLARSDILMIALFFPDDPELVAVYAVASMLAGVVKKVRQGFDNSLAPALATLIETGDRAALQATYAQVARWVFALWIPLAAGLGLSAPLLLSLFGQEFPQHWVVVPILMAGRLLNAAGGPAQIALLMAGRSRLELLNNAAINVLNIAANALMIPRYGVVGAAAATAFAMTVFNAVRVLQVRRIVGIGPNAGQTLRLCAALSLSVAPPVLLLMRSGVSAAGAPDLLTHGLATCALLLAYPLWLWTLGLRQELSAIGRFLRRQPVAQG
jgi:O-antigen/teichoic acid export membrane protein